MASGSGKTTQPGGACNGTNADFTGIDQQLYDYQMHTKMCKKIAQLTKVIYSLNTKNEEHEAALQSLCEAHQEELRRVTEEAQGKLVQVPEKEVELKERLQTLEDSLEEQRRVKAELLDDMEGYRQEAAAVREELEEQVRALSRRAEQLEQERAGESHTLKEELEVLRAEKLGLEESCRRTVNELKEAQQEEQETLRRSLQQSLADKLSQWQQREHAALQHKLKRAEDELEVKGQRLSESRRHASKLQERNKELEGQLEEARRRVDEAEVGSRKAEEELAVAKERLLLQETELLNKSEELLSQCSSQTKASAEVEELRAQVSRLQMRVRELEHLSSGKASDYARLIKQHGEALVAQRQDLQRTQAEELRRVRQQTEEERGRLREQLRKGLEEVMRKHAGELRNLQASMEAERTKVQKDLRVQVDEVKRRSDEERRELEREKETLCSRLQEAVCEISRLEAIIQEAPPPCGEHCKRLSEELEQSQEAAAQMKDDLELQKGKHQAEISDLQREMETVEEKLSKQAEKTQEEKTRVACECLRRELTEQHLLALAHLQRECDTQVEEINESWRRKVKELQSQLEEKRSDSRGDSQKVEQQKDGLRTQQSQLTFQEKEQLTEDIREVEESLRRQHEESMRAEWHSHQLALRALEERAQADLQAERQRQQAQQKLLLDRQKAELTQQHADWSRQVTQRHMQQMEDLQAELRTHTELVALQQDFKQQNQVQAFERQLDECHSEILGMKRENNELKEQLSVLQTQLECRSQDPDQHQRRSWEEEVLSKKHLELDSLKREHRKEIQTIVSDFSGAQTRLQARIVSLETDLREKDEKTKRRESRVEDIHLIGQLQEKLSDREQVIKRLLEERHQLQQHAQVNSESSSAKVYENRPQQGSLTPTLRKRAEEMPPRVTSVPNLSSYEKSFLGPEAAPAPRSSQAVKSPSFEHSRSISRTNTPTSPIPEARLGLRYSRSPTEDLQQSPSSYNQPTRAALEQRICEPSPEIQDLQRQEWFTKYFSF